MIQQKKDFNNLEEFLNSELQSYQDIFLGIWIKYQDASSFFSALGKCTNLSNLTLSLRNQLIGDETALQIGSALANCANLSNLSLDLIENQLDEEGALGFVSALSNCNLSNMILNLGQEEVDFTQLDYVRTQCLKVKRLVTFELIMIEK